MSRSLWKGPYIGVNFIKMQKGVKALVKTEGGSPISLRDTQQKLEANTSRPGSSGSVGQKNVEKRKLDVITYSRSSVILKEWIGLNIGVHNGNKFIPVFVISPMVGHRLGEFARTRLKPAHPKKTRGAPTPSKTENKGKGGK
jgi:small subunit ribosomal protein S19